jgi:hypothetical protein
MFSAEAKRLEKLSWKIQIDEAVRALVEIRQQYIVLVEETCRIHSFVVIGGEMKSLNQ